MKQIILTFLFAFLLTFLITSQAHADEPVAGIDLLTPYLAEIPTLQQLKDELTIEEAINEYGTKYEVDTDLIKAIIFCESGGKVTAKNKNKNGTYDSGLMQINSFNYEWLREELGITDFFDIKQNIHCGVYMLSKLLDKYSDLHTVLMAYNMGETQTLRLHKKGIYSSQYSKKIIKIYEGLKEDKR